MNQLIIDVEPKLTRDFFLAYDWPAFLDAVCTARNVQRGEKLSEKEFSALIYAAGVTVQMSNFEWDTFIRYVHNVRDYFAFRGCTLKKINLDTTPRFSDTKAVAALYKDLGIFAVCFKEFSRFTIEELRNEVINFVYRLAEKGYVFT